MSTSSVDKDRQNSEQERNGKRREEEQEARRSERLDALADFASERPTGVRAELGEPFVRDFHLQDQRT